MRGFAHAYRRFSASVAADVSLIDQPVVGVVGVNLSHAHPIVCIAAHAYTHESTFALKLPTSVDSPRS